MLHALCVMETHLGHATYYQNLRQFVAPGADLQVRWAPISYRQAHGVLARLPGLPTALRGALRGRSEVRQGLQQARYDVALFNTQVPAALAGRLVRRQPYLIATDLTPVQYDALGAHYGHQPDRAGLLGQYKHLVNTRLLRGAARLLPWSSWAARSLIDDYGVDPARVEVLPPGVDLTQWQPASQPDDGPLRVLFVGGDLVRKGGDSLLRAFRSLPPGAAELHLVTRSALAPEAGVVIHHGLQPNAAELVALYRQCQVFVLPTHAEAFGIAAVEACAAGLPLVATAVGGLTDIVQDGENGFLIAPGDEAALAARLRQLLADQGLRQRMGRAARQRAEARFDARQNAQRLVACLAAAARRPYSGLQIG